MLGGIVVLNACNPTTPAPRESPPDEPPATSSPPPSSSPPLEPPQQSQSQPAPPPATPTAPGAAQPPDPSGLHIDSAPYEGPPVTVLVVQAKRLPPISTAMIEITVPTGGWTLNLDKGEVAGETARIFLTLERPGDGEMVTHALVTHKQQFTSEKPPFTRAQVYVHLAQRGIHTLTANYRLAASQ